MPYFRWSMSVWILSFKELTLLLSDLVKLLSQVLIVFLIFCRQTFTFLQKPTNMSNIALYLTRKETKCHWVHRMVLCPNFQGITSIHLLHFFSLLSMQGFQFHCGRMKLGLSVEQLLPQVEQLLLNTGLCRQAIVHKAHWDLAQRRLQLRSQKNTL